MCSCIVLVVVIFIDILTLWFVGVLWLIGFILVVFVIFTILRGGRGRWGNNIEFGMRR